MQGRVLIVEDNTSLAENIAELFEDEGGEVRLCHLGSAALAAAAAERFDVAVVDLGLPDIAGVELVPKLRPLLPDGEVILMTGDASLDTAIAAVRQGVFAYVQKPFLPPDLLALGERALAQVQLRRERARLAHELRQSERLYRGVVESVESLIVGVDGEGKIQMWNQRAALTTGFSQEELLGSDFVARCVPAGQQAACRELLAAARQGPRAPEAECDVVTREGRERIVRWHLTSLPPDAASGDLILLVGTDVTDRLALEKRAADAEAMASLATLTAGLAHEIRNPLNAALLQLELLTRIAGRVAEPTPRARLSECARLVQSEIQRLSRLLEEFLNLARPRTLERGRVDIAGLCEYVVAMQRPVAEAAGVTLALAVKDDLPAVSGDQPKLTQVLINLVVNAIDAMRGAGPGEIVVGAEPAPERRVRIWVGDRGPGLADEVAGKIFRPFVSTKERGTGLGLAIVKRIVDLHEGTIELRPREGGGTIAELVLRAL